MLQFNFARHSFQWKRTNFYEKIVAKSKILWRNDFVSPNLFHYHIIRGEDDYSKIWNYIDTNPQKWDEDCFYNDCS